jgi:hypothetical protein
MYNVTLIIIPLAIGAAFLTVIIIVSNIVAAVVAFFSTHGANKINTAAMTDAEKFQIMKDLLILSGRFSVIPKWATRCWPTVMACEQRLAADRLVPHLCEPLVLAMMLLRGDDPEHANESADEAIRRLVREHRPDVAIPLAFAFTKVPPSLYSRVLYELAGDFQGYCRDENTSECVPEKPICDEGTILAVQQAATLAKSTNPDMRCLAEEVLSNFVANESSSTTQELRQKGELAALGIYVAGPPGLEACKTLLDIYWMLGICVLAFRYQGPRFVEISGEEKSEFIASFPAPVSSIFAANEVANVRYCVTGEPRKDEASGRLLDREAPEVRRWLDLEINRESFTDDGPEILEATLRAMKMNADLKYVYDRIGLRE